MIIGGLRGLNNANKYDNIYNRRKKTHDGTRTIQSVSRALIKHLYESLQLFGELFDTEESSLFQHAYRGDDCQNNV